MVYSDFRVFKSALLWFLPYRCSLKVSSVWCWVMLYIQHLDNPVPAILCSAVACFCSVVALTLSVFVEGSYSVVLGHAVHSALG